MARAHPGGSAPRLHERRAMKLHLSHKRQRFAEKLPKVHLTANMIHHRDYRMQASWEIHASNLGRCKDGVVGSPSSTHTLPAGAKTYTGLSLRCSSRTKFPASYTAGSLIHDTRMYVKRSSPLTNIYPGRDGSTILCALHVEKASEPLKQICIAVAFSRSVVSAAKTCKSQSCGTLKARFAAAGKAQRTRRMFVRCRRRGTYSYLPCRCWWPFCSLDYCIVVLSVCVKIGQTRAFSQLRIEQQRGNIHTVNNRYNIVPLMSKATSYSNASAAGSRLTTCTVLLAF